MRGNGSRKIVRRLQNIHADADDQIYFTRIITVRPCFNENAGNFFIIY